jgi:hypothetical protein
MRLHCYGTMTPVNDPPPATANSVWALIDRPSSPMVANLEVNGYISDGSGASPLAGHHHIGIVTPAPRTDQPLMPSDNRRLGTVPPRHFGGIGTCATFGGTK